MGPGIDEFYSTLIRALDTERHADDCAYRCLNRHCGGDHWCDVCRYNDGDNKIWEQRPLGADVQVDEPPEGV